MVTMRVKMWIFSAIVVAFGILVVFSTYTFGSTFIKFDIGPAVYPRILGWLIILMGALMAIPVKQKESADTAPIFSLRFGLHAVYMLVFLLLFEPLGFILSAILILIPFMIIMGEHRPSRLIIFPIASALVLHVVFTKLLNVPLPAGVLGFLL